jgi:hypothetical protein
MEAEEGAGLIHTQVVRGSNPCAPTIIFNNLQSSIRGKLSTMSANVGGQTGELFLHVPHVSEKISQRTRMRAADLLRGSQAIISSTAACERLDLARFRFMCR